MPHQGQKIRTDPNRKRIAFSNRLQVIDLIDGATGARPWQIEEYGSRSLGRVEQAIALHTTTTQQSGPE